MNSVQYMNRNNDTLTFEDRCVIKNLGRPTPILQIEQVNITQKRTYKRTFNKTVYEKYSWLCGCETTNKFYCFPCILAQVGKPVSASDLDLGWIKYGVNDLKHLDAKVKSHSISQRHLKNELEISMLGKTDIRSQLSSAHRDSIKKHNKTVDSNRYILSKLIDGIKFCGAFELALRGHDETYTSENPDIFRGLVNLMAEMDSILEAHLKDSKNELFVGISKQIQNELLDSMLHVCRDLLKKEIHTAKYVAIQADETNDTSTQMQIAFIIRYVKNGEIYERFWDFLIPKNHTADGIADEILTVLSELGIDKDPKKLIAQSYDGTSMMRGSVGGVQAKIKNIYKNAQYIHCYAHQLNLIIERCCTIEKGVKVFFANLSAFPAFFSRSSKRKTVLDSIVKKRLPRAASTRWNFTSKCVNTVYIYKEELLTCLEEIMDAESDKNSINQAQGLINYLMDDNFKFWLFFFNKIMPHCDILFDQLQSRQLDALKVKKNLVTFSTSIQNIRDNIKIQINQEFGNLTGEKSTTIMENHRKKRKCTDKEDPNPNIRICKEICDTLTIQVHERFGSNVYLTVANLFETEKFGEYRAVFPNEDIKTVCNLFANVNYLKLKNELSVIYARDDFMKHSGAVPLLQMFIQNNLTSTFSESVELLTILCTVPMMTVESERCFSTLKRIKTFLRNTIGQERLCALAMLSIEKKLVKSISNFNDQVIDHFAAQKLGGWTSTANIFNGHGPMNPFLYRRDTTLGTPENRNPTSSGATEKNIGHSGQSNSAPDSYNWAQNKQKSTETNLEAVKEINIDPNGEETPDVMLASTELILKSEDPLAIGQEYEMSNYEENVDSINGKAVKIEEEDFFLV